MNKNYLWELVEVSKRVKFLGSKWIFKTKLDPWKLVEVSKKVNLVGSKWIFKTKLDPNRNIERYETLLEGLCHDIFIAPHPLVLLAQYHKSSLALLFDPFDD